MERSISTQLRQVMRHVAQPVSIVTTSTSPQASQPNHGATLSSFSSVALHPLPLVAFSLQLPSRLADALQNHANPITVHLLSEHQRRLAHKFARHQHHNTQNHPHGETPFAPQDFEDLKNGSVGNLSCSVIKSIRLDKLMSGSVDSRTSRPSEMFLAVVDRISGFTESSRPLVYYNKSYHTLPLKSILDHDACLER